MNQEHNQNHEMELRQTHYSGVEEWVCPQCERRFVMQWTPYKKIVLTNGDEYALHSGGKGGVQMGTSTLTPPEVIDDPQILSDDLRSALDEFLSSLGD